jgi:hypothetical protein
VNPVLDSELIESLARVFAHAAVDRLLRAGRPAALGSRTEGEEKGLAHDNPQFGAGANLPISDSATDRPVRRMR